MTKATDPVCGSAASRGVLTAGWLSRFPIWRRTRCALAGDENTGHLDVVIRLPVVGLDSGTAHGDSLDPDMRNRPNQADRPSKKAGPGQTGPREGRTQAGGTRTRMPRIGRLDASRNVTVDVSHEGTSLPESR